MKINQLKAGSILSYLQMALSIIIGLLYTPVMIRLLGQSEYGLYNTVSSTIAMMSILSLGFTSSYIRYYSKYKKFNDNESIYKLNGMYLLIYTVIAVVVMLCGLYLTFNLNLVFDNGLTAAEYKTAKTLVLLLSFNLATTFILNPFSAIISAHEKFIFLKSLAIGKTVISPLVTLPLLLMGYRSITMVLVTVIISIIVDICYLVYVIKRLNQKFIFGRLENGLFKSLFSYTAFIALNTIIDQINWSLDKVLLGRFNGTAAVAVCSVGYSLYHYYQLFSTSVSSMFTPKIHRLVREYENSPNTMRIHLTDIFTKIGRIQFLILALIATGVFFFGKPFIVNIWAGKEYSDSYIVAVMLIFSSSIALIQNLGIEIQRALNRHQFRSIIYFLMAILNIVITVILAPKYGAVGAAAGTTLSLVIANGFIMNIYYHLKCDINIISFWKNILRVSLGLIPPVIAGILINKCLNLNSIIQLVLGIFIYALIYCVSMWILSMNKSEKELITGPLKRKLKK